METKQEADEALKTLKKAQKWKAWVNVSKPQYIGVGEETETLREQIPIEADDLFILDDTLATISVSYGEEGGNSELIVVSFEGKMITPKKFYEMVAEKRKIEGC